MKERQLAKGKIGMKVVMVLSLKVLFSTEALCGPEVAQKRDLPLVLDGTFSIGPSYTLIDKPERAIALHEGWENRLNIFMMTRTEDINITGSGSFIYPFEEDEEDRFEIENIFMNLEAKEWELTFGDFLNNLSEFSASGLKLRGVRYERRIPLLDGSGELFGGMSKEPEEATPTTPGTFAQYYGGGRVNVSIETSSSVGISLFYAMDDEYSISSPQEINPLSTTYPRDSAVAVVGISHCLLKNLSLNGEYAQSRYEEESPGETETMGDESWSLGTKMIIEKLDLKLGYKRVGPNYYTAGNPYLLNDREGADLKAFYPFGEISSLTLEGQIYDDNLDGVDPFTKRTMAGSLKFRLAPKRWPALSLAYRERRITSNQIDVDSGRRRYDDSRQTLSLGLSGGKKTTWNLNLQKTYLYDNSEYTDEDFRLDDREFLTGLLVVSSRLLRNRLNLMLGLSDRIFENITKGVREEETFHSWIKLDYRLIPQRLRLSGSYNYSADIDKDIFDLKESIVGVGMDYYLSTKNSFSLTYKGIENREDEGYWAETIGLKYTRVF